MERNAKDIIPAYAAHPGSVLRAELEARGILQKDFAKSIGVPVSTLSEVINGRRNINVDLGIKLEDSLGIPFDTWMALQYRYHYVLRRQREREEKPLTTWHGSTVGVVGVSGGS